ncbi:MAG: glycosyltransferase family 4 protein [Ignavibacteriales bacterium]|nr:glycosyltransferase family 4 protein [Ignavibacteriales bacterium]
MNLAIFTPYLTSMGGGEKYVLVLAEAIAKLPETSVTLLVYDIDFEKSRYQQFFNVSLTNVKTTILKNGTRDIKKVTEGFDTFINLSNFQLFVSNAHQTIQLLQVPYGELSASFIVEKILAGEIKDAAKDIFRLRLISECRNKKRITVTNSQFVHDTLLRHHNVESFILAPPIDDFFVEGIQKEKIILSVGRIFAGLYNQKRYDITTKVFRELAKKELSSWEYHIVGSVANDETTMTMLQQLQRENSGFPVFFHLNEPYAKLKEWYNRASLFWHAAGYEVDEEKFPERTEHFGMSTVEAMSAYAVPLVVNKGGQKEIVEQGMNGFVWNALDELKQQTILLAKDEQTRKRMANNARERFFFYSRNRFSEEAQKLIQKISSNTLA